MTLLLCHWAGKGLLFYSNSGERNCFELYPVVYKNKCIISSYIWDFMIMYLEIFLCRYTFTRVSRNYIFRFKIVCRSRNWKLRNENLNLRPMNNAGQVENDNIKLGNNRVDNFISIQHFGFFLPINFRFLDIWSRSLQTNTLSFCIFMADSANV